MFLDLDVFNEPRKMKSLSTLGLGLSVIFVCLLLALIAEIYYLLWWKKRIIRREIENDYTNPARDYFLYMFGLKKKPSLSSSLSIVNPTNAPQADYPEFQFHTQNSIDNKDYIVKPLDENGVLEPGLITGPPRFLFTIKEETKEDLESEDGKTREGKRSSLSELLKNMETPYLTPLSSPPFVTPPITPMGSCHSSQSGSGCNYNPLYESSSDAEFSRMVKSSPPPKFKFLRDAEEKLKKKTILMEEAKKKDANLVKSCNGHEGHQDGSFLTVIVANSNKNGEIDQPNHHYHSPQCLNFSSSSSSSSQVYLSLLPLQVCPHLET